MVNMEVEGSALITAVPENLERSVPAPSVQELMKDPQLIEKIPARYAVGDDVIVGDDHSTCDLHVPRIDMAKLVKEEFDSTSDKSEFHKLLSACKDWGAFQLVNHGVPVGTLKDMKESAKEFFELPIQEKMQWAHKHGGLEGYGHNFVKSDEQKLDWHDMMFYKALPIESRSYHLWPDKPTQFRGALETYSKEMRELALSIVNYLLKGLMKSFDESDIPAPDCGNDYDHLFCESLKQGEYHVRVNYYPPCPQPERVIGISPHIDISVVTLLIECGDTPGLQLLKDGKWVIVPPLDGAIIVNLGAMMQIFSNGTYKAPDHRVMVNKHKERVSIATFCYLDPSLEVGPSKKLTEGSAGQRPLYKTVTNSEYFGRFFNLDKASDPFLDGLRI